VNLLALVETPGVRPAAAEAAVQGLVDQAPRLTRTMPPEVSAEAVAAIRETADSVDDPSASARLAELADSLR